MMEQQIKQITPSELVAETLHLKTNAYRLVAISCTTKEDLELTYSFDKEYDFVNLRLHIDNVIELDSISSIYSYAFLYENEIKELFGANIKDISIDFNDNLYKIPVKTPFGLPTEKSEAINVSTPVSATTSIPASTATGVTTGTTTGTQTGATAGAVKEEV